MYKRQDAYEAERGHPNTKEDRVACLKPCDSATADLLVEIVGEVRTAQSVLFHVLVKEDATPEEVKASREQLVKSIQKLQDYVSNTGIIDMLGKALGEEKPWMR